MMNTEFTPFPVLNTERLTLRELNQQDAKEIFFFRSNPQMLQYIDREPATTMKEISDYIQLISDTVGKNETILWAITIKNENRVIGTIAFWRMEKENYRAEIGYVLHPDYQKKGIMSEAITAALQYGFSTMKLHSVLANINPENDASRTLLARYGFVKEAYFRENYYFKGKFLDSEIYVLLNKED